MKATVCLAGYRAGMGGRTGEGGNGREKARVLLPSAGTGKKHISTENKRTVFSLDGGESLQQIFECVPSYGVSSHALVCIN